MDEGSFINPELMALYLNELEQARALAAELYQQGVGLDLASAGVQTFHRLKGVSAIIGYEEIGLAAGKIELLLKAAVIDSQGVQQSLIDFLETVRTCELLK